MGEVDEEELRILRTRAYGPSADIHADPEALERLRNLEAATRPPSPPVEPREPDRIVDPIADGASDTVDDDREPRPRFRAMLAAGARAAKSALDRLGSVRRSTWLVVIGVAVVASILGTAFILVQRVQTDPLQVGATQVARLSVDPGYEIPDFFGAPPSEGQRVQAFQEFHGLRSVTNLSGFFGVGSGEDCILIYAPTEVTITGNGSSGQFMSGCSAGAFPAMTQFRSDLEGFPAELREAFPDSTAFQFVYDRENNEVVVFASRPD